MPKCPWIVLLWRGKNCSISLESNRILYGISNRYDNTKYAERFNNGNVRRWTNCDLATERKDSCEHRSKLLPHLSCCTANIYDYYGILECDEQALNGVHVYEYTET